MDGIELIKEWPCWRNASSATVLASPAFRLALEYKGEQFELRPATAAFGDDSLNLAVRFDDENAVLSLADSDEYHDLHLLWQRKSQLPQSLLLALVEKECGSLLLALENAVEKQLSIKGIADGALPATMRAFSLGNKLQFALEMTSGLTVALGKLANLDTTHDEIRSLTRACWMKVAVFSLPADEMSELKEGCCLVLDDDNLSSAQWVTAIPDDEQLTLCSSNSTDISFGAFADDKLPEIELPDELTLFHCGKAIATGTISSIGDKKCWILDNLNKN